MSSSRRHFLKLSAAALTVAATSGCKAPLADDYPITVEDSLLRGHLLFEAASFPRDPEPVRREVLVVGGGIAGLAAACRLRPREVVVCEVGAMLGGSSASGRDSSGVLFAQGAHYDLGYPRGYGEEVLGFLESAGLIAYSNSRELWEFSERQYLIEEARESRTWDGKGWREDPIPSSAEGRRFVEALDTFRGKMPQPTRLIVPEYRSYDRISFAEWLSTLNLTDGDLRRGIDYQMRDDYGAGSELVSALAGIHYYQCRPYYQRKLAHFSPPEGNGYFVNRMAAMLPSESLLTDHLVASILPEGGGFKVEVLDLAQRRWRSFSVDGVVYAGQKHALKYTFKPDAELFSGNRYAPWLSVSFVLEGYRGPVYWQNEVIGADPDFLGFTNSRAQHGAAEPTVLTAYFCLAEQARKTLVEIQRDPRPWTRAALQSVQTALGQRVDRLVRRAYVKLHGHAMPIPVPGYLFRDANQARSQTRLVHAGVDNGRLPLLFEALDSGLGAADLLTQALLR